MRAVRLPGLEKWLARADITREPARGAYGLAGRRLGARRADRRTPPSRSPATTRRARARGCAPTPCTCASSATSWPCTTPRCSMSAPRKPTALRGRPAGALPRRRPRVSRRPRPSAGMCACREAAMPRTTPLHAAIGRDIFDLLPHGAGPLNWRSMITEAQMVLSSHEANARREIDGPARDQQRLVLGRRRAARDRRAALCRRRGRRRLRPRPRATLGVPHRIRCPSSWTRSACLRQPARPSSCSTTSPGRFAAATWMRGSRPRARSTHAGSRRPEPRPRASGTLRIVLPGEADTVVATLDPFGDDAGACCEPAARLSHHA